VPHHLNHTTVGLSPSQNRTCAIHAYGSSHDLCKDFVHADLYPGSRQGKAFQKFVKLFPSQAASLAPPIEPLKQELIHRIGKFTNTSRTVRYSIVGVVPTQLGFGCLPNFRRLSRPDFLQPLLERFYLGGECLACCNPFYPKPVALFAPTAVMGEPQKVHIDGDTATEAIWSSVYA
jgi:hypothetical protein